MASVGLRLEAALYPPRLFLLEFECGGEAFFIVSTALRFPLNCATDILVASSPLPHFPQLSTYRVVFLALPPISVTIVSSFCSLLSVLFVSKRTGRLWV